MMAFVVALLTGQLVKALAEGPGAGAACVGDACAAGGGSSGSALLQRAAVLTHVQSNATLVDEAADNKTAGQGIWTFLLNFNDREGAANDLPGGTSPQPDRQACAYRCQATVGCEYFVYAEHNYHYMAGHCFLKRNTGTPKPSPGATLGVRKPAGAQLVYGSAGCAVQKRGRFLGHPWSPQHCARLAGAAKGCSFIMFSHTHGCYCCSSTDRVSNQHWDMFRVVGHPDWPLDLNHCVAADGSDSHHTNWPCFGGPCLQWLAGWSGWPIENRKACKEECQHQWKVGLLPSQDKFGTFGCSAFEWYDSAWGGSKCKLIQGLPISTQGAAGARRQDAECHVNPVSLVTYRACKLDIHASHSGVDGGTQLAELVIVDASGKRVRGIMASSSCQSPGSRGKGRGGGKGRGLGPAAKAVDGDKGSKYFCDEVPVTLVALFSSPTTVAGYDIVAADDHPGRDPKSFTFSCWTGGGVVAWKALSSITLPSNHGRGRLASYGGFAVEA